MVLELGPCSVTVTCEDSESAIWKVSGAMVWDSRKNLWLSMAWLGRREGVCGVEGCLWGRELTRPLAANWRQEVQDYLRLQITSDCQGGIICTS